MVAGEIQILADAASPFRRGSWGPDNSIYFSPTATSSVWKVSASGGVPQEVTRLDRSKGEQRHSRPQVLPGGKAVLFTVVTGETRDERHVHAQSLETGERHVLVQGGENGHYVSTGHLVYNRSDQLMAVPMDLARLEVTGATAIRLAEQVITNGDTASYAVSDSGVLVYVPGSVRRFERRLVWVDRNGRVEALPAPASEYSNLAISPDGRRAIVAEEPLGRLWIYDFARASLTPIHAGGLSSFAPIWTPDGTRIVYRGTRKGLPNLFWKAVDSTSEEERLTTKEGTQQAPGSVSPDGKWLAFDETSGTGFDILVLPLDGERKPQSFLTTPFAERTPRFSPDGRWLAYRSNESGRDEIYVQPFPSSGRKWPISTEGGTRPVWSRNGRELFYLSGAGSTGDKMMAVDITTQPTFSAGSPRLLFEGRYIFSPTGAPAYDVSLDGQRFLRIQAIEPAPPTNQIQVVMNWFEELKQRVPTK